MSEDGDDVFFCVHVYHHADDNERWIQEGKLYVTLNIQNDFVPPIRKSASVLRMCRRDLPTRCRTVRRERE